MKIQGVTGGFLLAIGAAALPAQAHDMASFDAASAQAVLNGCVAHAEANGQSQGIVVVDAGGHIMAALRMDGNGPGIIAFAEEKAYAAATWGFATSGMEQGARNTPGFADAPGVVTVGGGVPIYDSTGQHRLGAIGVSGEPPEDDVACAEAGIAAGGFLPSRVRQ